MTVTPTQIKFSPLSGILSIYQKIIKANYLNYFYYFTIVLYMNIDQ